MAKKNKPGDLQAEVTGKVRWAIGTSLESYTGWTYSEQRAVASVLSQDIIFLAGLKRDNPESSWDSNLVRNQLRMRELDKAHLRVVA